MSKSPHIRSPWCKWNFLKFRSCLYFVMSGFKALRRNGSKSMTRTIPSLNVKRILQPETYPAWTISDILPSAFHLIFRVMISVVVVLEHKYSTQRRKSSREKSNENADGKISGDCPGRILSGCKIRLTFNDGMVRVMDFEPFLRKALNPDITKYRQLRNFKKFHLHHAILMWGDFDMIFPMEDLHHGNILKARKLPRLTLY